MTDTTKMSAKQRRINHVRELAVSAFANHKCLLVSDVGLYRHWRCQKPGTWCYGFDVVSYPGGILVRGDVGFLAVERVEDMLTWLPGALKDLRYLSEKVPSEIEKVEYDPEVVAEILDDFERTGLEGVWDDDAAERMAELLACDIDNPHEMLPAIYHSGFADGGDFPDTNNYKHSFLWCVEALRWFMAHKPDQQPPLLRDDTGDGVIWQVSSTRAVDGKAIRHTRWLNSEAGAEQYAAWLQDGRATNVVVQKFVPESI